MTSVEQPPEPPAEQPRRRPPARSVTVVRTVRTAPNVQLVTFGGAALEGFAIGAPAGHVKLFLPPEGQPQQDAPTRGPDGWVWGDGQPVVVRTYTPRRFDAERRELDVEFFLHGTGPASLWAERAAVGEQAMIAGPGRGYEADPTVPWFLLAGDESALPAIATIVEALPPATTALVIGEVAGPADEQPLAPRQALTTTWVHRRDAQPGEPLEAAIRAAEFPPGPGRVWVAGEASVIRRVRRHLLADRGLSAEQIVTRGYWRAGAANHPDHDYGDGEL